MQFESILLTVPWCLDCFSLSLVRYSFFILVGLGACFAYQAIATLLQANLLNSQCGERSNGLKTKKKSMGHFGPGAEMATPSHYSSMFSIAATTGRQSNELTRGLSVDSFSPTKSRTKFNPQKTWSGITVRPYDAKGLGLGLRRPPSPIPATSESERREERCLRAPSGKIPRPRRLSHQHSSPGLGSDSIMIMMPVPASS